MHYGTWVSQWNLREWNMKLKNIRSHGNRAAMYFVSGGQDPGMLGRLNLKYESWDFLTELWPNYGKFMVWMKSFLQRGYPVMFSAFVQGQNDIDFDHVGVAFGVTSDDISLRYDGQDYLHWIPLQPTSGYMGGSGGFETSSYRWNDFHANRGSANAGRQIFQIPERISYGVAVTGFENQEGTYPVHLYNPDTPNERPNRAGCTWEDSWIDGSCRDEGRTTQYMGLSIRGLTPGRKYQVFRYDSESTVPTSGSYCAQQSRATKSWVFEAEDDKFVVDDAVEQLDVVTYRVVDVCDPSEPANFVQERDLGSAHPEGKAVPDREVWSDEEYDYVTVSGGPRWQKDPATGEWEPATWSSALNTVWHGEEWRSTGHEADEDSLVGRARAQVPLGTNITDDMVDLRRQPYISPWPVRGEKFFDEIEKLRRDGYLYYWFTRYTSQADRDRVERERKQQREYEEFLKRYEAGTATDAEIRRFFYGYD